MMIRIYKECYVLIRLGEDHDIDVGYQSSDMSATLQGNIQRNEDSFVLHLEAKMCNDLQANCHQSVNVLSGIRFPSIKPDGKKILSFKNKI